VTVEDHGSRGAATDQSFTASGAETLGGLAANLRSAWFAFRRVARDLGYTFAMIAIRICNQLADSRPDSVDPGIHRDVVPMERFVPTGLFR
jgi:hypothetical protein